MFDVPITNLLSILSVLIEILSRAHAKGAKKALTVSDLVLLLVVFRVPARQSMAVKGLKERLVTTSVAFFVSDEATVQLGKSSCRTQLPSGIPSSVYYVTRYAERVYYITRYAEVYTLSVCYVTRYAERVY